MLTAVALVWTVTGPAAGAGVSAPSVPAADAVAGGTVVGRVTGPDGQRVPGVHVTVLRADGQGMGGFDYTTEDGTFVVADVAPGSYVLYYRAPQEANLAYEFSGDATSAASAVPLTVTSGGTTTASTRLAAGGTVTGEVVLPDGMDEYCVVDRFPLWATFNYGDTYSQPQLPRVCVAAGEPYTLTGLAAGDHLLTFSGHDEETGSAVAEYHGGSQLASEAELVTVVGGAVTTGVDGALAAAGPASTTVVLGFSPEPVAGEEVTLTATVSGSDGVPTGVAEFYGPTGRLGEAPLVDGRATLVRSLPAGSHEMGTSYGGDARHRVGDFDAHWPFVVADSVDRPTTTTLTASASTVETGDTVTLTARVASATGGHPVGDVAFVADGVELGRAPLTGGSAVLTVAGLPVGSHAVTAAFVATPTHVASSSAPVGVAVVPEPLVATTTTLAVSDTTPTEADTVTLTATVAAAEGTATGEVAFTAGATALGSATLVEGVATFTTSDLAVGSHHVAAGYSGSATHASSSSAPVTVTVAPVSRSATTTWLLADPSSVVAGTPLTFTAHVVSGRVATGEVAFAAGEVEIGRVPLTDGTAVLRTDGLAVGTHDVTATYEGSSTHAPSTSEVVTVTVDPRPDPGFSDVPESHPFAAPIAWLVRSQITTGYDDGTFRPTASVTRQAMAAFLYRAAGSPAFDAPATSPFLDVATDHPFYEEIAWLAEEGISTGTATPSGAVFAPADRVSRQAMAAFLHRAAGAPPFDAPATSPFRDVPTGHVFYTEIAWLAAEGISTGTVTPSGADFKPSDPVSRQAMAAFLQRAAAV